jgi:hypothetical protein
MSIRLAGVLSVLVPCQIFVTHRGVVEAVDVG